jgi:hypothetical protein
MKPSKKLPTFGASAHSQAGGLWQSLDTHGRGWGSLTRLVLFRAGFVDNAEVMNSRAAMIGFFALIALEAVRGQH